MMAYATIAFSRWHANYLLSQGSAEGGMGPKLDATTLKYMEQSNSWTATLDGMPLASAGTIEQWPGRHLAWAYLNMNTGQHMLYITRQVMRGLDMAKGRIELTVREDFEKGHRWAKLLGFEVESPVLRAFGPEGENHVGYVKFNRG